MWTRHCLLSLLWLSMITLITGSSSDHLFQVYYKVRQVLLQSATAFFITKCDDLFMTKCDSFFLQSATSVVTKCDSFFYYKVRWSVMTKCDSFFITKCDKCCYKVRQVLQSVKILLQSATDFTKCDDYYKVRQYMVSHDAPLSPLTAILKNVLHFGDHHLQHLERK